MTTLTPLSQKMIEQAEASPSNRAGNISACDRGSVQVGNNDHSKTFHGGTHLHGISPDTSSTSTITRDTILRDLAPYSYRERKDINPPRVPGTCQWFVSHERYKQWRRHPSSSMLLVSADPGCGKSVLAKFLVDEELKTTKNTTTTCYFFFKDGLDDQASATVALRCILHQLLLQRPDLFSDDVLHQFQGKSYLLTSAIELWDLIITIIQDPAAGEIILIFDAFDECNREGRARLEKLICQFYGQRSTANASLKLLVTSRPHEVVSRAFRGGISELPILHLAGESEHEVRLIAVEIDLVIEARVRDLAIRLELSADEAGYLRKRLSGFKNRTYLWFHLTLDVIENAERTSQDEISKIIDNIPESVLNAYERILNRSSDDSKARKLLNIMVAATRPLSLAEMAVALELDGHHAQHSELHLMTDYQFQKYLRDLCGLFIVVINNEVFFLHQTARDFLMRTGEPETLEELSLGEKKNNKMGGHATWKKWQHTISARDAHRALGRVCVMYLLLPEFADETEALIQCDDAGSAKVTIPSSSPERFPFLKYASRNWASHCRSAGFEDLPAGSLLRLCGLPEEGPASVAWTRLCDDDDVSLGTRGDVDPLLIASKFGVTPAVESMLTKRGLSAKRTDPATGRSALSFAAEQGFDDIVKLLLNQLHSWRWTKIRRVSKHVDNVSPDGRTPLSFATLNGHTAVARRLIRAGARPDTTDKYNGSPLVYALCSDDEEMVRLVLDGGSKVLDSNVEDNLALVLCSALYQGQNTIVSRIVKTKRVGYKTAIPDRASVDSSTSTWTSLRERYEITLFHGWPAAGEKGGVPFTTRQPKTLAQLAACTGNMAFFRAFDDIGQPVNVRHHNPGNGSLLHWAAANLTAADSAAVTMIDELLSRGATVDQTDEVFQHTALHWALWAGNTRVALLLLKRKADPYKRAGDGRSAFQMGFWPYSAAVFLEGGLDLPGLEGLSETETASLRAAISEDLDYFTWAKSDRAFFLRLIKPYDVSSPFSKSLPWPHYFTGLRFWEFAFLSRPTFEVRDLAAAAACVRGRHELLAWLLPICPDRGIRDMLGNLLLYSSGYIEVVRVILDHGLDVNAQDARGRTLLHGAVLERRWNIAKELLRWKVDLCIQDMNGETVLHRALRTEPFFMEEETLEVTNAIIRKGPCVNVQDHQGRTALHIIAGQRNRLMTKVLLSRGRQVKGNW